MEDKIDSVNENVGNRNKNKSINPIKSLVSKNKRRFIEDGFDLDLSYITEQIIAMGYPSEGKEALYRNSIRDTAKFLNSRHKDCYRIYNLCSERKYDDRTIFDDENVNEDFSFDDHNPPVFDDIFKFTKDCYNWLSKGDK